MALISLLGVLALSPASAHHSRANFLNETIVLQGEIVRFRWVNPHALFSVSVSDASGKATDTTDRNPVVDGRFTSQTTR